jgi:hypothetical protein
MSTLPAHCAFAIFHRSTSCVVGLNQRMSLTPSALKSPLAAIW